MGYSHGAPQQPFRFLDLPLEVRNGIYNVVLCTPPPAVFWPLEQQDLVGVPEEFSCIRYPSETQLLRVNRQIHSEAKDAMLRGNQFIRIRGRCVNGGMDNMAAFVRCILRWRQIPILATTALFRDNFKGFVMTHIIDWISDGSPGEAPAVDGAQRDDVDVVILRRDLDVFCETFAFLGVAESEMFDICCQSLVEIHDPFDSTLSPGFMSEVNQERLLQPYRDHFRGFSSVKLHGHVASNVAEAVKQDLAEEQLASYNEALAGIQMAKDLGNTFFRRREFHKAAAAYWIAFTKALYIRRRNSWVKMTTQGGTSFVHAVAELYYQVCLNAAQNILTYIRETSDPNPRKRALRAVRYVSLGEGSGELFSTDWRPTLAQMAKANFRMASAYRAMGDIHAAKRFIDTARLQAPGDQIIRREAEEIDAETRAQAGLGRLLL
ncbi:hypothetical protein N0V82_001482 [Gnomoniopsis sp. IMI 355080]|nr:hypothetical protein N0V82_001482 [Gnomoniopsis sp. IMI 355080]